MHRNIKGFTFLFDRRSRYSAVFFCMERWQFLTTAKNLTKIGYKGIQIQYWQITSDLRDVYVLSTRGKNQNKATCVENTSQLNLRKNEFMLLYHDLLLLCSVQLRKLQDRNLPSSCAISPTMCGVASTSFLSPMRFFESPLSLLVEVADFGRSFLCFRSIPFSPRWRIIWADLLGVVQKTITP